MVYATRARASVSNYAVRHTPCRPATKTVTPISVSRLHRLTAGAHPQKFAHLCACVHARASKD